MLFSRSLKSTRISLSGSTQRSITRFMSSVSVCSQMPRFSMMSARMSPIESFGMMIDARIVGSRISRIGAGVRHVDRVVHLDRLAAVLHDVVNDARISRDDLHVVLAADALLDDLHVQQAEEAAAKAEPERERTLRGIDERRVVQPQTAERRP